MGFGETLVAIVGTLMVFGIPISAIWTSHFRKLAEIKARQQGDISAETRAQLAAMREEMAALRDTTTKFDMSFDAALSRLEQRVDRIEERNLPHHTVRTAASENENVVLQSQGR
jgi:ribosomal protein L16 Arg81 hydroxylase